FRHAGRLGDAEDELRKVLEIDEHYPLALGTLGAVCAQQDRFEESRAWTERAQAAMPWSLAIVGQLAAVLARTGSTDRAGALLDPLMSGTAYGAPTGLAIYYAMGGDLERAAHWAERSIDERFPPLVAMLGPLLRNTRQWPALAKLMNLPQSAMACQALGVIVPASLARP